MRKSAPALALAAVAALCALALAAPDGLSDREAAQLKQQLGDAFQKQDWPTVCQVMPQLARANDKKTWDLLVRVAERAPEESGCAGALRAAAEAMTDRRAQDAIKKTAVQSRSVPIRRELVGYLGNLQDWASLIELMGDKDEQVASIAAWKLVDNRVEAAIDPMIALMDRLDRSHDGIWDVLHNGLGKLLGGTLGSAVEYRSRWTVVKEQGGLASVPPPKDDAEQAPPPAGELHSGVRLFGREIDCTRIVFILDCSGSMVAIDPEAQDPAAAGTQTHGGGDSQNPEKPQGKTRLQRAQEELKRVLNNLPATTKVNIVAYSSPNTVSTWHGSTDGTHPPQLYDMTDANRRDACTFVDQFRASGTTATSTALRRAFDVEGARCFYLLSDGFATDDGQTPIPTDEILQVIDELGKDRHVTIHTLGFRGADRDMMMAVARHTGGKYSDIR
jgi:hypothetical protein